MRKILFVVSLLAAYCGFVFAVDLSQDTMEMPKPLLICSFDQSREPIHQPYHGISFLAQVLAVLILTGQKTSSMESNTVHLKNGNH